MANPGLAPRLAAVQLMNAVIDDARLLSELLPQAVEKLAPDDRARAGRIATETLRWMDRADRVLGPHLRKRPPTLVMNVLRLGVVEICHGKEAAHGVVNCAVDIVQGDPDCRAMKGLVNAVLRKVAADSPDQWAKLPSPQMPKWLRKQLVTDFGKDTIGNIEAEHAKGAPLDLTVKSDPQKWAKELNGLVLPNGSVRLSGHAQVSLLPGFDQGEWWVQDAAANMPAQLLAVRPGERVLDMCAAPGGKTLQMASAGAEVTALDISEKRMKRVAQNLERTGLQAELVISDALKFNTEKFDAILVDAPCSATGTIRRHPDLPYAKDSSGFAALFKLQEKMLDHALSLLKPKGRLVYCTCSLLIDEGEEQIKDASARHKGLLVDRAGLQKPFISTNWMSEFGVRTRPDYWSESGGMDGFFMTVLRKVG